MTATRSALLVEQFRAAAHARIAADTPDPCRDDLARWAEVKRGFVNAPHHLEWYGLVQSKPSLCIVAPRDSAKSECLTINNVAWRSERPGHQSFVFGATDDLAKRLKERIDHAIEQAAPALIIGCPTRNEHETVLNNGATINAAGAGKAMRGVHPDCLIGDDVLDDEESRSHAGRLKKKEWWLGTVEGMRHPGTWRRVKGQNVWFEPTVALLCGTPMHQDDLLMSMRTISGYTFRRYASEFDSDDLVPGTLALEATDVQRRTA